MAEKIQKTEIRRLADLTPDPHNANRGTERGAGMLETSLRAYGAGRSLLVDKYGVVIAGNKTLEAAASVGLDDVVVVQTDGTKLVVVQRTDLDLDADPRAKALGVADNRVAQIGLDWDAQVLQDLVAEGADLGTMFSDKELAELVARQFTAQDGLTDPDDVPATRETDIVPGDIIQLGRHRLMCGDSTNTQHVARLMGGQIADLCFTSPPYALGKSVALSGNKSMSAKGNAYDDHDDDAGEWGDLMRGWFAASVGAVNGAWVVNVQPLAGNKRELMRFVAEHAEQLVDIVTWDKGHAAPQMAQGVMASRYEWMVVLSPTNGASRSVPLSSWRGTVQSVYTAPPQRGNKFASVHAATMPSHVPEWVMSTLCDQSRTVYEPFCGTGTTLIAAERLGRTCFGMEISPQYCDVIVERWEQFTGQKAERITDAGHQ